MSSSAEQQHPRDHYHHPRQRLTPRLGFYLGLCLFFFFHSPFLFPFSRHIRDFAATAMLAATSLPRPFFTTIPSIHPTPRSRYRPLVISAISSDREALPMASSSSKWAQKTVVLPAQSRGCHLVTSKIMREIERDLSGFKCGLAHFFLQHTSASLTINENYDQDVQADTETFLNRIVPEGRSAPWRHTLEGPDDMPAHIKSSMFGCSLTIPITNGGLNMGTWQGIWLCEHRDHATPRKIVVTMNGM